MNRRRLETDREALRSLAGRNVVHALAELKRTPQGLPYSYRFKLHCLGLERVNDDLERYSPRQSLSFRDWHTVDLYFQTGHPDAPPSVSLDEPLFHPNVSTDGSVCYGVWRATWDMDDLVREVRKVITYEKYTINDDHLNFVAVKWARLNGQHFPLQVGDGPAPAQPPKPRIRRVGSVG